MKTRTAVLYCLGGAIAAALGYCGIYIAMPHKAANVPLSRDLLLLVFYAMWLGGCVFFVTSFVACVVIAIRGRWTVHRPGR
jgi:hypothetical protein